MADKDPEFQRQVKLAKNVIAYTLYEEEVGDKVLQIISNAKSPATGIGKAIIAVALPVAEAMAEKQPDLDPAIWMTPGGVLDEIIDELIELAEAAGIEVSEEDAAAAREVVFADIQKMAASQAQGGADPMAAEGGPPSPAQPAPQGPAPLMQRGQPPAMGGAI